MAQHGKDVFLGLNVAGLLTFVVLLFICLPIFWVPWLIPAMRGKD